MILCFDIGGSRIRAALADGTRLDMLGEAVTPATDFAAFVAIIAGFAEGRALRGVAISIAGVADPDSGLSMASNIPCVNGRNLAEAVTQATGRPAIVLNDADSFALAEAMQGAGRGHRTVFGVILGTGVGGGLVIDGRVVTGPGGFAGEWGHGPVLNTRAAGRDVPHFPCGCGLSGCIETVGGARGLERLHRHLNGGGMRSEDILERWEAGDLGAARVVDVWCDLVAPPLAMIVNTVGCSIVPVGGGLSNVPALIDRLDRAVRGMVLRDPGRALVTRAEITVEPGLVGAAAAGAGAFG